MFFLFLKREKEREWCWGGGKDLEGVGGEEKHDQSILYKKISIKLFI